MVNTSSDQTGRGSSDQAGRRSLASGNAILITAVVLLIMLLVFSRVNRSNLPAIAQDEASQLFLLSLDFELTHARWPTSTNELVEWCRETRSPSMEDPRDPWGNGYEIIAAPNRFRVVCYGADGKQGGEGIDADLVISRERQSGR